MERDRVLELASDRREIPPLSVAAMLGDEPRRAVHERRAATAADRVAQVSELGLAHFIGRREELRAAKRRFHHHRHVLAEPHSHPANRRLEHRRCVPRVRMAIREQSTVDDEHRFDRRARILACGLALLLAAQQLE